MADIREQWPGVPPFRAGSGNGHGEDDDLARAIRARRALLGTRLLDDTTDQVAAKARLEAAQMALEEQKLHVDREELGARLANLRAEAAANRRQADGGGANELLGGIVQLLMDDRAAQREAADKAHAAQMDLMRQMLEQARQPATPAAAGPTAVERVQEMRALIAVLQEFMPRPASPSGQMNAREVMDLEQVRAEIEEKRRRTEFQHQMQLRQLLGAEALATSEQQTRMDAAAAERARNERIAGMIEQYGPAALAAVTGAFTGQAGAQGGPELPGTQVTCPNPDCGRQLMMPAGQTSGVCPHCKQMVMLRGSDQVTGGAPEGG